MSLEVSGENTGNVDLNEYADFENIKKEKNEEEIKIEILFPEVCNLFGDSGNIKYLKMCMPKATFINTQFVEEPAFITQEIDLIYLGPMTENRQEKVIKKLKPYKDIIEKKKIGRASCRERV